MRVLFVDRDGRFVEELRRVLPEERMGDYEIDYRTCDVSDVDRRNAVFVSPANSFGFMDGGIDAKYMAMFPGVEERVQSAIRALGYETDMFRHYAQGHYLSVGSAVAVAVDERENAFLACCPTMVWPGDVYGTSNAYLAFSAALGVADKVPGADTLVCPGLATGVGRMPFDECAKQIREAFLHRVSGAHRKEIRAWPLAYVTASTDHLQPRNHAMRRFLEGDPSRRHPDA